MTLKKISRRNTRQKKIRHIAKESRSKEVDQQEHEKEEIRRQIGLLKKDYNRLLSDVVTSYDLIKSWVGYKTSVGSELIKSKIPKF